MAAGLAAVRTEVVALLAADLPYLTAQAVARLLAALDEPALDGLASALDAPALDRPAPAIDGAVLVDGAGRRQLLCGAWRVPALRARLSALGAPAGQAMRRLVDGLAVVEVRLPASEPPPWYDCDTEDDLRRAEEWTAHDRAR